jgi:hypothetical protein
MVDGGEMTQRLTTNWTPTAGLAFGATGEYGDAGEIYVKQFLENHGFIVDLFSADKQKQEAGTDIQITFSNLCFDFTTTADVKHNIKYDTYTKRWNFAVDVRPYGWLFDPKKTSEWIIHVNVRERMIAVYRRCDMIEHLRNVQFTKELFWMYLDELPPFIRLYIP